MSVEFYDVTQSDIVKVDKYKSNTITRAPDSEVPNISPSGKFAEHAVSQPYINESKNSRLPAALPNGSWQQNWQAEIDAGFLPLHIMYSNSRILVFSNGNWRLYRDNGEFIAKNGTGRSPVVVDVENQYLLTQNPMGMLVTYQLSDGKMAFKTMSNIGSDFMVTHLSKMNGSIFIAGVNVPLQFTEGRDPDMFPRFAIAELFQLGDPFKIDETGLLESKRLLRSVKTESDIFIVAATNNNVVFALKNEIFLADVTLQLNSRLTGKFLPLAMSLGDEGYLYLIVRLENGSNEFWLLSDSGKLLVEHKLPAMPGSIFHPPIIGYDQRVFLFAGDHILVLSPRGKVVARYPVSSQYAGATVTQDNYLLVSDGSNLTSYAPDNEAKLLWKFSDPLTTPPVLTNDGRLYVSTTKHLQALKIKH